MSDLVGDMIARLPVIPDPQVNMIVTDTGRVFADPLILMLQINDAAIPLMDAADAGTASEADIEFLKGVASAVALMKTAVQEIEDAIASRKIAESADFDKFLQSLDKTDES